MIRGFRLGLLFSLLMSAGCGSGNGTLSPQDAVVEGKISAMNEVGMMLNLHKGDRGKAPSKVADLAKYEFGCPIGYQRVKDGDIVVIWGAPLQEGASEKIIAHEKQAPDAGGYVLMQDGTTVKKLTAEEFKAAPKAA
jgi:hypothetical protein